MTTRVVRLFTKPSCTLCDPVKYVIQRVQQKIPFEFLETNIDEERHKEWNDAYKYDIPVVHLDGQEIARHKLKEADLIEALK